MLRFPTGAVQAQLSLQFDYRFDTSGFFDALERRAVLQAAANEFSLRISDSLAAIAPDGTNGWNALVIRPDTGTMELLPNLNVPANTLTIFAGARSLSHETLGVAESGGLALKGSMQWQELARTRGQSGAPLQDFGPWGGSLTFDNSVTTPWYFDLDPFSVADLPPDADDFFSVAVHELGHLFGFGTAASWHLRVNGGFTGSTSILAYGGIVPLEARGDHWADGTMSRVFRTGQPQETAMTSELLPGSRRFLTDLDVAGLQDIGWVVIPEPSAVPLLILAFIMSWPAMRKRIV